jgi:hypothetical protein
MNKTSKIMREEITNLIIVSICEKMLFVMQKNEVRNKDFVTTMQQ